MTIRYVNEAEAFPLNERAEETEISEFSEVVIELDESIHQEVLRIEENLPLAWRGVQRCGRQDRVDSEARSALEKWVKDKLFQYRDLEMIGYGNGKGRVRCNSSGGNWGNPRRCGCRGSLPCYIEFRNKP